MKQSSNMKKDWKAPNMVKTHTVTLKVEETKLVLKDVNDLIFEADKNFIGFAEDISVSGSFPRTIFVKTEALVDLVGLPDQLFIVEGHVGFHIQEIRLDEFTMAIDSVTYATGSDFPEIVIFLKNGTNR